MQITDLNKVINLFLVGSLTLVTILFLWFDELRGFYQTRFPAGANGGDESSAPFVLLGTLAAFSLAMFLGCVIDGLSEVVFRRHFKSLSGRERPLLFPDTTEQYANTEMCREMFRNLLMKSEKYGRLYEDAPAASPEVDGEERRRKEHAAEKDQIFAAAFFFRTAKPEHVSWLVQHHSVHILVSDYIVLSLLFAFVFPVLHVFRWWAFGAELKILTLLCILIPVLLSIYPLFYLAVDRRFYTYEIAYRNNILFLCEEAAADARRDAVTRKQTQR